MNELPVPPDLASDPDATEVIRAWVVNQQLEVSLATTAFEEPDTWGVLLAEVVRFVAEALHEQEGKDPEETVGRIVAAFEAQINASPEDEDEE